MLGHEQDAEDAFQAAFLILARKAASIRQTDVGGFLYRVAYHLAVRARADAAKHGRGDKTGCLARLAEPSTLDPLTEATWREVRTIVAEELQRLPDALRCAVVLCYLEGKTRPEAARLLGWSRGTLHRRLERGRELLRRRLLARGLTPLAALTASLFAEGSTSAMVPAALAGVTVRSVLRAAPMTPAVAALVKTASASLFVSKTKVAAVILLAVSLLSVAVAGGLALSHKRPVAPPAQFAETPPAKADEKPATAPPQREAAKTVQVQGRVLGVDGQPKAGAKLWLLDKDGEDQATRRLGGRWPLHRRGPQRGEGPLMA